jgi:acetylcholinesterase
MLAALLGLAQVPAALAISSLKIDTTSGPVQGAVDSVTPNVAHFLGIPFAEQPLGARRWLPPAHRGKQNQTIDATNFGPACPQFEKEGESVWANDATEFIIAPRDFMGEDCLAVNVWTPWKEDANCAGNETERLPVIAWIHGGSFQTGGPTVPYQDPSRWVERSGKHIVVGIK